MDRASCGRGRRRRASGRRSSRRVGAAQVALDVGQPRGAGRGRRSPGTRAGRAGARRRARAGAKRRRVSGSQPALDVAGGVEDRATTCPTIAVVAGASSPATWPRSRGERRPRPTPARPPRAIERVERRGRGVLEHRGRRCRAARAVSASSAALPRRRSTWRSGRRHRQAEQPAGARRHRGLLRLRASRARARRPSRPRRRAPDRRARRRRCPAARPRAAAPRASHARMPRALEAARRRRQLGAQARAHRARAARRGRGPRRARCRRRPRPRSSCAGARAGDRVSHASRGTRTPRARSISRATASSSGPRRGRRPRDDLGGDLGDRHQRAAQVLGQRADQRGDELLAERRARASRSRRGAAAAAPSAARATVTPSRSLPGSKR